MGTKAIYFPPGDWYAVQSGEKISGPQTLTRTYALDEIPLYVRGGRVLPMEQYASRVADLDPNRLSLAIWGGGHNTLRIYDDDGLSPDYQHGNFRIIPVRFRSNAETWRLTIEPVDGLFSPAGALDIDIIINDLPVVHRVSLSDTDNVDFTYDHTERRLRTGLQAVLITEGARLHIEISSEGG